MWKENFEGMWTKKSEIHLKRGMDKSVEKPDTPIP